MMNPQNYIGNRKGIQTILAALLMVVIVVVAAVMVYAWSTGLLGTLLVNPNNNKEGPLALDTTGAFSCNPSCTNVTLYIRNSGSLGVTLNSYYITDSSGNTWQVLNWANGAAAGVPYTIGPNQVVATNLYIAVATTTTTCGSGTTANTCSYTGASNAFIAFNAGSYTVKVITARNNPFTFTVTR